ncbi:MAG: gliding motility protein GldN [Flavobacteriales bacterium]|jgi:gliding motility associated protien GldN|nr:gliding motility protein GldN [Flavobacteriales bacterium]
MRARFLLFACCFISHAASGQYLLDGAYIREHAPTRRAVPAAHLREADVLFCKRVWRVLDLREKLNHPFIFPLEPAQGRRSLFDVVRQALLKDGTLTAYAPGVLANDDSFSHPMLRGEVDSVLNPMVTVWTPSLDDPDTPIEVTQPDPITAAQVTRYQIKEDWYFDKQRGVMDARIIGIAPMKEVRGEDGELRGHAPLFWLYYAELRHVLANAEAFNPWNDGGRITFDQLLESRRFSSYVVKESNAPDRRILEHARGIDALVEGDAVKERLFRFEHDLWNH